MDKLNIFSKGINLSWMNNIKKPLKKEYKCTVCKNIFPVEKVIFYRKLCNTVIRCFNCADVYNANFLKKRLRKDL